jgi:DNA-binding LytR/AlgR family response regulator
MRVIIVEDEKLAVHKLESLLIRMDPSIEILARLESVKETVRWLKNNPKPHLGFFDIQLSDASSFEIFKQVDIFFPVIFITAYDDYLIDAFEYNSIHYILKPVTGEKINQALNKVKLLKDHYLTTGVSEFLSAYNNSAYKSRLVVRKGIDYTPIETKEIAYVFTEHKISFLRDRHNQTFILDESLSDLVSKLDPKKFFRANRQYLIHVDAIKKFTSLEQSKILLELDPPSKEDVIVSKENAVLFRKWIKQ